jgi:hypothetical protein
MVKSGLILMISIFFIYSCSGVNRVKIENENLSGDKKILIFRGAGSIPVVEIIYPANENKISQFSTFAAQSLLCFYPYIKNDIHHTYRIPYSDDYYRVFYSIGFHLLSDWKNDLFKYGIIEIEWEKLLTKLKMDLFYKNDDLTNEYRRFFRVGEIDDLLSSHSAYKEYEQIYPYTIRFHLKEITFISIQEFYSRQARYYSPDYVESLFTRMTVIPESVEFTRYILKRFGKSRFLLLASTEYNSDNWEKITDEKISETEENFSRSMENYPFNGIFRDALFTNQFYNVLKIYNKNTKQILFRK